MIRKSVKQFKSLRVILLFILIGIIILSSLPLNAVTAQKVSELKFDYEISLFILDDQLVIWDTNTFQILIYRENKLLKTVKLGKGQGPRDFLILNSILSTSQYFILFDRMQSRISYFDKNWNFLKIERLSLPKISFAIGNFQDKFIFQWNDYVRHPKGIEITQNIGVANGRGEKFSFEKMNAQFNTNGRLNYERPFLVASHSNGTVYYANNQEYKVYSIDLKKTNPTTQLYFQKNTKSIPWKSQLNNLRDEIYGKLKTEIKFVYPNFIPPIFSIIASEDVVGVVTNENILKKQTVIDFYKKGQFKGKLELPLIPSQHSVTPPIFFFNTGIALNKDYLYALIYDSNEDVFKVIKWKIVF